MPEIFDLDNAFVYYVDRILPGTPGGGFADIISVINSSGVELAFTGSPDHVLYSPSPEDPSLPVTSQSFFGGDFINDQDLPSKATFKKDYTETASFSLAFTEGVKVGAKTTLTTKIPFLAEGKVELSAEGSFSSTQNDTSSQSQTFTINVEIPIPPRKGILATVRLDSLKYQGTVTTKVQVKGRIFVNFGSTSLHLSVADVFKAIKSQPPGNYSRKDTRTTYTFTDSQLALFEVTPTGEVLFDATAAVEASYAVRASVIAKQHDLASGLLEAELAL